MMSNQITMFFHCAECLEEKPSGVAPRDWVKVEVGWTEQGIQVWCIRHELNVVHLDFLGQKVAYAGKTQTDEEV